MSSIAPARKRGRPLGSKNKKKKRDDSVEYEIESGAEDVKKITRNRPYGYTKPKRLTKKSTSDEFGEVSELQHVDGPANKLEKKAGRKTKGPGSQVGSTIAKKDKSTQTENSVKNSSEYNESELNCNPNVPLPEEMIRCDNRACVKKWLTFTSAKITVAPVGEWFCSRKCRQAVANVSNLNFEEEPEEEEEGWVYFHT